jgi:regulator of sirC expression with transglutaminase-like and TPR domain
VRRLRAGAACEIEMVGDFSAARRDPSGFRAYSGEPLPTVMFRPLNDLDYFRLLIADPGSIPLLEAAASIGSDAYPSLDLQGTLARFDRLAGRLAEACSGASTETDRLRCLMQFFRVEQGFTGNLVDYYHPDNSYIHRVLETRRGIPISLAVLLVELARHIGLDACGVSFPGHFLVRVDLHDGMVVIDPFAGTSLDLEELEARSAPFGSELHELLAPASAAQILTRMLNNLHAIHVERGDTDLLARIRSRLRYLSELPAG